MVDTVGAGDAFTSALMAGLHRADLLGAGRRGDLAAIAGRELAAVLDVAVLASAINCTRRGADPPTLAELLASQDLGRAHVCRLEIAELLLDALAARI